MLSQYLLTAINLQYSANTAYWTRFSTNPAISFLSSTGDCPISFSSVTVVSVTHFSVYGAGTTSVSGQQNGGFICQSQYHWLLRFYQNSRNKKLENQILCIKTMRCISTFV